MTKAIIVVGNTKHEAEQWIAQADMPQPCLAVGKNLRSVDGMRIAQVLILNTVKDLPVDHINQLRRQLAISTGGAHTLEAEMQRHTARRGERSNGMG